MTLAATLHERRQPVLLCLGQRDHRGGKAAPPRSGSGLLLRLSRGRLLKELLPERHKPLTLLRSRFDVSSLRKHWVVRIANLSEKLRRILAGLLETITRYSNCSQVTGSDGQSRWPPGTSRSRRKGNRPVSIDSHPRGIRIPSGPPPVRYEPVHPALPDSPGELPTRLPRRSRPGALARELRQRLGRHCRRASTAAAGLRRADVGGACGLARPLRTDAARLATGLRSREGAEGARRLRRLQRHQGGPVVAAPQRGPAPRPSRSPAPMIPRPFPRSALPPKRSGPKSSGRRPCATGSSGQHGPLRRTPGGARRLSGKRRATLGRPPRFGHARKGG